MAYLTERNDKFTKFLQETGDVLASSLDYPTTLKKVAEFCVPFLGDWCIIDLYVHLQDELQRVTVHHADARKAQTVREFQGRCALNIDESPFGPRAVVRSLKPEVMTNVDLAKLSQLVPDPVRIKLATDLGLE